MKQVAWREGGGDTKGEKGEVAKKRGRKGMRGKRGGGEKGGGCTSERRPVAQDKVLYPKPFADQYSTALA